MERHTGSMSTLFTESGKVTPEERTLNDMTARSSPVVVASSKFADEDVDYRKTANDGELEKGRVTDGKIMSCIIFSLFPYESID